MVARRKTKRRVKKLSTRFKERPVATAKAEWRKLGIIGKGAVVGIAAGALAPQAAIQLNTLPVVGKFMSILTNIGANLRGKMR